MKYILFSIFVLSGFCEAGVLKRVQNDAKTSFTLSQCKSAVEIIDAEFPDTVACPQVIKYSFKNAMSMTELKKRVEVELKYTLSDINTDWSTLLAASFYIQTGYASENLSEGSGQYTEKEEAALKKSIKNADSSMVNLSKTLVSKGTKLGAKVFIDSETLWGPKIKAKAIIILNAPQKNVEVYLHGDLDG